MLLELQENFQAQATTQEYPDLKYTFPTDPDIIENGLTIIIEEVTRLQELSPRPDFIFYAARHIRKQFTEGGLPFPEPLFAPIRSISKRKQCSRTILPEDAQIAILFILALAQSLVTPEPEPPEDRIKKEIEIILRDFLTQQAQKILQTDTEAINFQSLEALTSELDKDKYEPELIKEAALNTLAQSIKTAMRQNEPSGGLVIEDPKETELYKMAKGVFEYTISYLSYPKVAAEYAPYFPFSSLEWPEDAFLPMQTRQLYLRWLNNYLHGEASKESKTAQFATFVAIISSMPPETLRQLLLLSQKLEDQKHT